MIRYLTFRITKKKKESKEKTKKQTQQPPRSSHLNKGTQNVRKQIQKHKKKNYKMVPTLRPPHPHPNINQLPPTNSIPPSICNDNTMDIALLVKLRKSNKCGSVRNDEIINLHLGSGAGP